MFGSKYVSENISPEYLKAVVEAYNMLPILVDSHSHDEWRVNIIPEDVGGTIMASAFEQDSLIDRKQRFLFIFTKVKYKIGENTHLFRYELKEGNY